ncbi:MAG: hypothetical protein U0350_17955 [Caldilineaceae bacterium]
MLFTRRWFWLCSSFMLLALLLPQLFTPRLVTAQTPASDDDDAVIAAAEAMPRPQPLNYGVGVAEPNAGAAQQLGFNWLEVYDLPNQRYPIKVLYRVKASAANNTDAQARQQFAQTMHNLAAIYGDRIDAYAIGNEVNLNANGWGGAPDAQSYAQLFCLAASQIKQADPTAVVVSAGLATVGRVKGVWQGHKGHDGNVQDEREYLREFLAAGGAACADAIGIHPLGFRANFDAQPDKGSRNPDQDCANGLCFRNAEKLYALVKKAGYGNKPLWATETGWIAEPNNPACLNDPSWQGRAWQRVSLQKQAQNLAGAQQYARQHWPWLGALFVFNLNFNQAPYYPACEQMRYYSIQPVGAAELNQPTGQALPAQGNSSLSQQLYLPLIVNNKPGLTVVDE